MTDRERLIELARQTVADFKGLQASGPALKLAERVVAELDPPQPRELWGGSPDVLDCGGGPWQCCRFKCIADELSVYGPTRADAIRRYNAAAEAIERSDREAGK